MNKRELIESLTSLDDEAEILFAIITPKDETEGFEMGADETSEPDEDDDTVDNGDGTVTNFEGIDDVQIVENDDPETGKKEKFGALIIDMTDPEEGEDEDEDDDSGEVDATS